jgi:putative colanic acid biosynthesis acetyltransferase WcaB
VFQAASTPDPPSTLLALVRNDARANAHDPRAMFVVVFFRVAAAARGRGEQPRRLAAPLSVLYKLTVEWVLGIDLPLRLQAGPGLRLHHAYGLVVHPHTRLGSDVVLKHGVTIGHRGDEDEVSAVPTIGDRVVFGPNAQVLGDVTVGDDARIGAGAVVLINVPAGATAVGVPARVLGAGKAS